MRQPSVQQKECRRCREVKKSSQFYVRTGSRDGLKAWCIDCVRESCGVSGPRRKQRVWSREEDEVILQIYKTSGAKGCLQYLEGRTIKQVRCRAYKLNVTSDGHRAKFARIGHKKLPDPPPLAPSCPVDYGKEIGMNLYRQGPHAAADWLLIKLRLSRGTKLAVHVLGNGQMVTRAARTCGSKYDATRIGIFSATGISYKDVVDELTFAYQHQPRE